MKNKLNILFTASFLLILLVCVGVVSGVECGVTPTDGCTVTTSTTFDTDTYYMNGSFTGAIQITASNVVLDCNGSIFICNSSCISAFYNGIYWDSKNNITIRNCNLQNYFSGIRTIGGDNGTIENNNFTFNRYSISNKYNGLNNFIIKNNYFANETSTSIYFSQSSTTNIQIINNTFNGNGILDNTDGTNTTYFLIENNTFYKYNTANPIKNNNGFEWKVNNNYFYGTILLSSYGAYFLSNNTIFSNNYISGFGHSLFIGQNSFNTTILNNTIENGDDGMRIQGDTVYVINNTIRNMTFDIDTYSTNGWFLHARNIIVDGNNYSQIGSYGITLQNTTNITIRNNNFNFLSWTERASGYLTSDRRTPTCMIQANELVKGWLGDSMETTPYAPFFDNKTNKIGYYHSTNITIYNNTYDDDTQCFLMSEGIVGLSHDFNNFWYRSFQMPVYLKDKSEFWINNNFENLSWIGGKNADSEITTPQDYLYSTYYGSGRLMTTYKIHKEWEYFQNLNSSTAGNPLYLISNNKTNALFYNGTAICNGSSSDISSNDNNINITLRPNEPCWALQEFNVSETYRTNSPIWFSSSSDTEKHIASNLTNSVTSLVLFNVNSCDNLGNIYYTPNGDTKITYQRGSYTCSNNIVQINLQINPSAESNVLELEYGCNTFTRIGFRLIMLFSSLAILGFTFFFIKFRYDTNGFQVGDVIILFIGILVSIIIYTIFGQTLGGACGVIS